MDSPYADLDRPPLSAAALEAALERHAGTAAFWREVRVVAESPSTQAVLADAARAGQDEGLVVVAEHQVAGRGRHERVWVSPPRAGLTFSMLLRPRVPPAALTLLPLLVGVSVAGAIEERAQVAVRLKWPNDLLVGERKVAGILAEAVPGSANPVQPNAVVIGLGVNVSTTPAELPVPEATSLRIERGEPIDRQSLLLAVLRSIATDYLAWIRAEGAGEAVLAAYRERSSTIGQAVQVSLPGGATLDGTAQGVDLSGRLLVRHGDEVTAVAAGDVIHVRAR